MSKREFRVDDEYRYNRAGPVRWILSHAARYAWLPLINMAAAALANTAFSYRQILTGQAFDLITTAGWQTSALVRLALLMVGAAVLGGAMGLARSISMEFVAQRIERNARDELYVSLLGKSQTFHSRQRVGDVMARATNDVRMLNYMFAPGLSLIIDSLFNIIIPIVLIGRLNLQLLLVPCVFLVLLTVSVLRLQPAAGSRSLRPCAISSAR